MAQLGLNADDGQFVDLILPGAEHASPQVRYWAQIALGAVHNERGVAAQIRGLGDPVKMVREAARWGMRQTLLDDKGWDHLFAAYADGGRSHARVDCRRADHARRWRAVAHGRRLSAPGRRLGPDDEQRSASGRARLGFARGMELVGVESAGSASFERSVSHEPGAAGSRVRLVETAKRYQTEALFIANGQRANGSKEHQYPELAQLFEAITQKLDRRRLRNSARSASPRLRRPTTAWREETAVPGRWVMSRRSRPRWSARRCCLIGPKRKNRRTMAAIRLAIEASANATWDPLQKKVLAYSSNGPEHLRTLAATSLSDPRVISLPGTQEFLEPLATQIQRGAQEPERRERAGWSADQALLPRALGHSEDRRAAADLFWACWCPRFRRSGESSKRTRGNCCRWTRSRRIGIWREASGR